MSLARASVRIVGTGIDITPIARVARLVADHGDRLSQIFTGPECADAQRSRGRRREARYAESFAAKEAVMKAIGTGWRSDVGFAEIDTSRRGESGTVTLTGGALAEARRRGIARMFVSASTTREDAVAAAVAESDADV